MEQIQVISRNAIPPIQKVNQGGEVHDLGELRDFRWNEWLREFMPESSRFSVSSELTTPTAREASSTCTTGPE